MGRENDPLSNHHHGALRAGQNPGRVWAMVPVASG